MKSGCSISFVLVILAVSNSYTYASVSESPPLHEPYSLESACIDPIDVIEIFLKAVDNEELTVFDTIINRAMLLPVRVEYIFELINAISSKTNYKIYSRLNTPLIIPGSEYLEAPVVKGVSVIINLKGKIISTEAHVWSE